MESRQQPSESDWKFLPKTCPGTYSSHMREEVQNIVRPLLTEMNSSNWAATDAKFTEERMYTQQIKGAVSTWNSNYGSLAEVTGARGSARDLLTTRAQTVTDGEYHTHTTHNYNHYYENNYNDGWIHNRFSSQQNSINSLNSNKQDKSTSTNNYNDLNSRKQDKTTSNNRYNEL